MGIAPYKTFTFDGESSADYGVYITGTGVFNAPKRSVEMVEIAGRNGSFALDKGKFENIEVTYKVGIVDDSEADFADRVSDFRNWLCSKVGYCRLEDEYNPNEYRMGVYSSGVEIDHDLLIAGEAEITFNCKPQRWLTSGETAVSVADGGTLDNPTRFESEPLLAVEGYGNINFNGYDIDIENAPIGNVVLSAEKNDSSYLRYITIDDSALLSGDAITVDSITVIETHTVKSSATITSVTFSSEVNCVCTSSNGGKTTQYKFNSFSFVYGTASSETASAHYAIGYTEGGTTYSQTGTLQVFKIDYDGANKFTIRTPNIGAVGPYASYEVANKIPPIIGFSTKSALGHPTYIDCDIGECYIFNGVDIISINSAIDLGSDLPKLASGTNTINYDNTVTSLEVTPRWWKL